MKFRECQVSIKIRPQNGGKKLLRNSKTLIVSNIELFLNYCTRLYDRQFMTRDNDHKGILERFENLLNEYFSSDRTKEIGLPWVAYYAEGWHLSANYFGDLIRKETAMFER